MTVGGALLLLIISKVVISGFYLQSRAIPFAVADVAMAEGEKPGNTPGEKAPPPAFSPIETMEKRNRDLNAREIELQKKEDALLPLKNEIDEKLAQLNELQARLTAYAKQLADREKALEDSKMGHLVELYTAMEPDRAAAIMDNLKISTVVRILKHMKGKSAGRILAMMKPERGAVISERLSQLD